MIDSFVWDHFVFNKNLHKGRFSSIYNNTHVTLLVDKPSIRYQLYPIGSYLYCLMLLFFLKALETLRNVHIRQPTSGNGTTTTNMGQMCQHDTTVTTTASKM